MLVCLMLVGALAELASLSAVVPFVTMLATPEQLGQNLFVQQAMAVISIERTELPAAITLVFGALVVVSALIRLVLVWAATKLSYAIGYDLSVSLYSKTLQRPYSFHVSRNTSEIIGAVNKVQEVVGGYITPLVNGLIAAILSISIILTLIAIDPIVALGGAGVFGLSYFAIALTVRRRLQIVGNQFAYESDQRILAVQEGLGAIRDVILDRTHNTYQKRFAHHDAQFRRALVTSSVYANAPRLLIEAIGMLLMAGFSLAYGASNAGFGGLLPVLGALGVGAQKLMPLIQQIYAGWSSVLSRQATLHDVLELLDFEPVVSTEGVIHFNHAIRFHNVSFNYAALPDSSPVLKNIELTIGKGEKVGIVGITGCGKSTLLDLMMGLLCTSQGQFIIDDQIITPANVHAWQKHIAHVPQNIFLSDTTVGENIAFGLEESEIDWRRVQEAAEIAQIHDHITSLPQGYKTPVGERGVRLSGGQRQRIGIARALYKKADVLVLDEATSALDDETENSVIEGVNKFSKNLTVIMIAHRLTTLKNCDRIIELSDGVISDFTTYESLINKSNSIK
jgi:ATP-binding cassette, subfamily B, bacterial PglK